MRRTRGGYALLRVLQIVPAAAAIVCVAFVLVNLAPGDPILALAGEFGDAEYVSAMRARFRLDEPLPERLLTYFHRVLVGDFGISYVHGRPAIGVILERLPATLLLTGSALLISSLLGVAAGVFSAIRRSRFVDLAVSAIALGLFAAPAFWVGQLVILGLAFSTGWFPVQGMTTAGSEATGLAAVADVARHLVLPALVLASQQLAAVTRLMRSGLIDELATDHVRTARGKGVAERVIIVRHALRRSLLPVLTVVGGRVGFLLSGAVVVEVVFGWPGIGRLMLSSIEARDLPVLMGLFFLSAFAVLVSNLITDLLYARIDPRIRYG